MKHLLVIALALVGILNVNPAPAATVFITGAWVWSSPGNTPPAVIRS